jgi:hypothetical protein
VLAVPAAGLEPVVEVAVKPLYEDGLDEKVELPTVPPRLTDVELELDVTFAMLLHCAPLDPCVTLPLPDVVDCACKSLQATREAPATIINAVNVLRRVMREAPLRQVHY